MACWLTSAYWAHHTRAAAQRATRHQNARGPRLAPALSRQPVGAPGLWWSQRRLRSTAGWRALRATCSRFCPPWYSAAHPPKGPHIRPVARAHRSRQAAGWLESSGAKLNEGGQNLEQVARKASSTAGWRRCRRGGSGVQASAAASRSMDGRCQQFTTFSQRPGAVPARLPEHPRRPLVVHTDRPN